MVNIGNDNKLLKYFRKRHLEPSTKKLYLCAFQAYHQVTGLTPTQAFIEADDEEEQGIRLNRRKIIDHLDNFEEYLEDNYKERTLKIYLTIIKSFYRFNRIQVPETIRRPPNPTPEQSLEQLPNLNDIKTAIKFSDIKYQTLIILLASSGMRQGDARTLTLKHLTNSLKDYAKIRVNDLVDIEEVRYKLPETIGPIRWDKWMQKKRRYYTTYSTPESLEYILKYLEAHPPKEYADDTYLFRSSRTNGFLTRNAFNEYFEKLDRRCQFPSRKGELIFFRPHNLRRWFGNQLKKTELGYTDTRHLMGHLIRDPTGRAYLKPDFEHLRTLYYNNMNEVTIFGRVEVHNITDKRVNELTKESEKKDEKIATLEKKIEEMNDRNKLIDKKLNRILSNKTVVEELNKM